MSDLSSGFQLLKRPDPKGHYVRFYTDARTLARSVGLFVGEGLREDETVVVIATPAHQAAITDQLRESGFGSAPAALDNRLILLDASQTLKEFMAEGDLDPARFEAVVGGVLDYAERRGGATGVRAYGEMVDVLWQQGRLSAAIRLEQLWDRLLEGRGIPLLCAYHVDILDGRNDLDSVRAILGTHTRLVGHEGRLRRAVRDALAEVLGAEKAASLRPIIDGSLPPGALAPSAETDVLWLADNLPTRFADVLARARVLFDASRFGGRGSQAAA